MAEKTKIIAVDFDGTLCEERYPNIGPPKENVIQYAKDQQTIYGAKIILWTCRTGDHLQAAINWSREHGLYFDEVNRNVDELVEFFGSDTRKIFANEYIDDRAMNTRELLGYAWTE
jgi:hypothetical protein